MHMVKTALSYAAENPAGLPKEVTYNQRLVIFNSFMLFFNIGRSHGCWSHLIESCHHINQCKAKLCHSHWSDMAIFIWCDFIIWSCWHFDGQSSLMCAFKETAPVVVVLSQENYFSCHLLCQVLMAWGNFILCVALVALPYDIAGNSSH